MNSFKLYLQLIVAVVFVAWGSDLLPRAISRPQLASSWLGILMMLGGSVLAARACYLARRGALFVGIVFLAFAALWAWNLHYWFDTSRNPAGSAPIVLLIPPVVLILLGIIFAVFFRYVYPVEVAAAEYPAQPPENAPRDSGITRRRKFRARSVTPWYRLLFLACSTALALVCVRLAGVSESSDRTQIVILVVVLGSVATGLISEETLTKILPWHKE